MNAVFSRGKPVNWPALIMFALGFWLSSSLLLDLVIIPSLSATGMMTQANFPSAGYTIFGIFNRVELVCAALVLTSFLVLGRNHNYFSSDKERWSIILSSVLLAIALTCTYFLTPQMSGLGLQLNLFEVRSTMPTEMVSMHEGYWGLEAIKLTVCAWLLRWCYRNSCPI